MSRANREPLEQRVVRTAEAVLARQQYVSVLDVLVGMGLLSPNALAAWRKGRIEFLEGDIQGKPEKIVGSIEAFHAWARRKGLRPSEAQYVRRTPGGTVQLRFTSTGDAQTEAVFRTHYISAEMPGRKREKLDEPPETVVFEIVRDSQCSKCGAELPRSSLLLMEAGQPLCLTCARLDDLEYLPAGDATLTRRAKKYSERTAVVVRFSRSRKRYERQGILVEKAALEQAERECSEE